MFPFDLQNFVPGGPWPFARETGCITLATSGSVRPASEPLLTIQSDARVTSLASSGSGGEGPVWLLVVLVLMLLLLMCRLVRSTETERSFPKSFCTRRSSEEIERAPTLALAKSTPARVDLQHGAKGGRDEWLD